MFIKTNLSHFRSYLLFYNHNGDKIYNLEEENRPNIVYTPRTSNLELASLIKSTKEFSKGQRNYVSPRPARALVFDFYRRGACISTEEAHIFLRKMFTFLRKSFIFLRKSCIFLRKSCIFLWKRCIFLPKEFQFL